MSVRIRFIPAISFTPLPIHEIRAIRGKKFFLGLTLFAHAQFLPREKLLAPRRSVLFITQILDKVRGCENSAAWLNSYIVPVLSLYFLWLLP